MTNPYNQYFQPQAPAAPNATQPQQNPFNATQVPLPPAAAPWPPQPQAPAAAPAAAYPSAWPQQAPFAAPGGFAAPPQAQPQSFPQVQPHAPQPNYGAPAQGGYSLNQAATAPEDLNLLPRQPGSYIVAVLNYQPRNSQSQGSFGGEQQIATFQLLRSADAKFPAGTQCTKIWRKGQPGNSGRGYGVIKDAKRQQQFVAAVLGLDPNDTSQNWDAHSKALEVRNFQQQPCLLEMRLTATNRPVLDRQTKQPTGEFWCAELFLPAPPAA